MKYQISNIKMTYFSAKLKAQSAKLKLKTQNFVKKNFKPYTLILRFSLYTLRSLGFCILIFAFCTFSFAQGIETEAPETGALALSENVTLDFKDADIRKVLEIISRNSGVNIVATPEVMGTVTIKLKDIHWEKALATVVRTYDFGYEWLDDKVIMVSTLEKLTEQRRTQEEAAAKEPLDTQAFALNFAKAEEIGATIEKLISEKGKITLEARTNTLIVTDTKSNLIKIGRMIKNIDKVTPQVLIEAKIIETNLTTTNNLGIKWTIGGTLRASARPTSFPFTKHSNEKFLFTDIPAPTKVPDVTGSLLH
ncbi:MAG: hypothetical protein ISS44_01300 [Candidatus Omnitrophica bacterium]|nr:hypothetical protein [Candidatus Omnitrophota bacterium]